MEHHRLGDYIREVNVRNRDLKVTNLLGLSIEKKFILSIANTIGTDMSVYKIIKKNQFAYVPVTSRNGDKITIALLDEEKAIISQAYTVFEIVSVEAGGNVETGGNVGTHGDVETHGRASLRTPILPEYLMMWFRRPEFDRYARFHSHGSAREVFDWDELCNVMLPIPTIARQREIVAEYETLSSRIRLNEQMIEKLEATAQALYRKMFVDGVDMEHLPEGWRNGRLSEIASIIMGQSPDGETYNLEGEGTIFYQGRTDFGRRFPTARVYTTNPTRYAKEGDVLLSVRAPVGDINIASHDCCIGRGLASLRSKDSCQSYLFYQLQNLSDVFNVSDDEGTIFGSINKDDLYNIEIVVPTLKEMQVFEGYASDIDKEIELKDKEINILTELQSLLLARMGK